jgi:hypothetical protein
MWIVASDVEYYPWVNEYETYEEAKAAYDIRRIEAEDNRIYIAEVKEFKGASDR